MSELAVHLGTVSELGESCLVDEAEVGKPWVVEGVGGGEALLGLLRQA